MYNALLKEREVEPAPEEFVEGDKIANYFLFLGPLKEALDAFQKLNRNSWMNQRKLNRNKEFQKLRDFLTTVSDRKGTSSFYAKYIRPTRNEASSHWDREKIELLLRQLPAVQTLPALFIGCSAKPVDWHSPLGDKLWISLANWNASSEEDMERCVDQVVEIQRSLRQFIARLVRHCFDDRPFRLDSLVVR